MSGEKKRRKKVVALRGGKDLTLWERLTALRELYPGLFQAQCDGVVLVARLEGGTGQLLAHGPTHPWEWNQYLEEGKLISYHEIFRLWDAMFYGS